MSESSDLDKALDALPAHEDWKRPYRLEDAFGIAINHLVPCFICGAMILAERHAVLLHGEWHGKVEQ